MRKPKIVVKLTQSKYTLSLGNTSIGVEAAWQGDLFIYPKTVRGGNNFVFQHSKPDVVRDIGLLFLEAAKLAKKDDSVVISTKTKGKK